MTLDEIDAFCTSLPACEVRFPFESAPALRAWCIGRRMFAWSATNHAPLTLQVKADPELIPALVRNYACISPGYHMNKRHWISINASMCENGMLSGLLEDAHALVAARLARAERMRLLGD